MALARLAGLRGGSLVIHDEDGGVQTLGDGAGTRCHLQILDGRTWSAGLWGGVLAFCDAYEQGWWRSDDLPAFIALLSANRRVLAVANGGLAQLTAPMRRLAYRCWVQTRARAQADIRAHYDLGDELFRSFLDPSLTYSAAWYRRGDESLAVAQEAKIDRACRVLGLRPGQRLLEIGSGWGALAIHAARHYGVQVTTTTVSANQLRTARERVAATGLEQRVQVLDRDWRDLDGTYDAIVSIEMVEALQHAQHGRYFQVIADRLAPGGAALIQAITIPDREYHRARKDADFIKARIFPGCCIPAIGRLVTCADEAGLGLADHHDLTPDYARTLAAWRQQFLAAAPALRATGVIDAAFERRWELYLAYCEGGFRSRAIAVGQMLFTTPAWQRPAGWA
jgi:cyclopropane-fatty-acyl-phospholipid synthase